MLKYYERKIPFGESAGKKDREELPASACL
jgi:hypothetical protein